MATSEHKLRIWVLAPGSGNASSMLHMTGHNVYVTVDPSYDLDGLRYPAGWLSMRGVALDKDSAVEQLNCSRHNLATLAGANFKASAESTVDAGHCNEALPKVTYNVRVLDLPSHAAMNDPDDADLPAGRSQAWVQRSMSWREDQPADRFLLWRPESWFDCLVCGSRGGQVTLPALWLLGCTTPVVVINSGCARPDVSWAWPVGLPVVMLAGGHDFLAGDMKGDAAGYLQQLWESVPPASRASAAIFYVPHMVHKPSNALLTAILPKLVRYAASHLAAKDKPTEGCEQTCCLVTNDCPQGEWLLPPASSEDKAAPTAGCTPLLNNTPHPVSPLIVALQHCGCLPVPQATGREMRAMIADARGKERVTRGS
mmetsp:Transcript_76423/g.127318  ORF Transcript_76423/g.127318 Transcript_76423/m.127318 type:complete len:370 (-) Transcript_76423:66-1175(-)|eukprot:CAMPEP_0119346624 /NCGR_PEP_ID=MMETSP1333-20130426/108098_1 /TAXON_ID=418940 /ORGANISM="Scyphosphaera apsteinii, Strain RCC1455" /LENGTH=369 /DNA_ID=CAMNT_0007359133 /DNA_START=138 /DNA_END=1247 /DNA_ORIENTATION=-